MKHYCIVCNKTREESECKVKFLKGNKFAVLCPECGVDIKDQVKYNPIVYNKKKVKQIRICYSCNGSGQGSSEWSKCVVCGGSG